MDLKCAFRGIILMACCVISLSTKILIVLEADSPSFNLSMYTRTGKLQETEISVRLNREDPKKSWAEACLVLNSGVSLVVDMTWSGWSRLRRAADRLAVAYIKMDRSIGQLLKAVACILEVVRNTTDTALIFQSKTHMYESLRLMVEQRKWQAVHLHDKAIEKLTSMTPVPSVYVIFASSSSMNDLYNTAISNDLAQLDDRWHLVFTDFQDKFNKSLLKHRVTLVRIDEEDYCKRTSAIQPCNFSCYEDLIELFLRQAVMCLEDTLSELKKHFNKSLVSYSRKSESQNLLGPQTYADEFNSVYLKNSLLYPSILYWNDESRGVVPNLKISINSSVNHGPQFSVTWTSLEGLNWTHGIQPIKRFFRIATGIERLAGGFCVFQTEPFAVLKKDPSTGTDVLDENNDNVYEGYCIDFINKLAKEMNFEYKLVVTPVYGARYPNGSWNGLVGLLVDGKVDLVVASLTMNSEREEYIDFVTPYFLQSGFLIVMRKKVDTTTMFKFLSVLKLEVWLIILAVIAVTTITLTALDNYSPYSGKNSKKWRYQSYRNFTPTESFWFSLTSLTPAGGGETPKSASARLLVAAYWIFVVLMISTFTANLAAFLTVERMQTAIDSLEKLSRQTFVKYTVVNDSDAHNYFLNMENAEQELFRLWKNRTIMTEHSDMSQYRVWDYPVKERYHDMLSDIENATPVLTPEDGFKKVLEHEQSDFAFIHDSLEIKYKAFRNCDLILVGDTFAEQPYSLAVQKGSHLNEELSRKILLLQKEKFLQNLSDTYWNNTQHGERCGSVNSNEGTSIESLGGVFIATFVGVIIALITLSTEIMSQRENKIRAMNQGSKKRKINVTRIYEEILTKREFGTDSIKFTKSELLSPPENALAFQIRQFY